MCRIVKKNLQRTRESRASEHWAKAMERVKLLETQRGRTLRCMGNGMLRKLCLELGKPYLARQRRKERPYKPER
ncbi:hypothetical protein PMJ10TS2_63190 [Paenibacillus melissococcoides]